MADLATAVETAEWGWQSLNDDLLIAGSDGVVNISSGAVAPQQEAVDDYRPLGWWALGAVLGIALLMILGGIIRRRALSRRAQRRRERDVPAHGVERPHADASAPEEGPGHGE